MLQKHRFTICNDPPETKEVDDQPEMDTHRLQDLSDKRNLQMRSIACNHFAIFLMKDPRYTRLVSILGPSHHSNLVVYGSTIQRISREDFIWPFLE